LGEVNIPRKEELCTVLFRPKTTKENYRYGRIRLYNKEIIAKRPINIAINVVGKRYPFLDRINALMKDVNSEVRTMIKRGFISLGFGVELIS
jgi:hypothetical protein